MSNILTNNKNYYDIADTIRQMKDVNTTYKPRQMAPALKDIYSNEVEGTLPLSIVSNGSNLLNYRIDGASGGVGDRTNNLFDEILDFNRTLDSQGELSIYSGRFCCRNSIDVSTVSSCTISWQNKKESALIYALFDSNNQLLSRNVTNNNPFILNTSNVANLKIGFYSKNENIAKLELGDIYNVMVNEGNNALNYEPYGYKIPVKINNGNVSTIYLDAPISENESISLSDTGVDIPTIDGTNVISIDTTVQPSNVYIQAPKDTPKMIEARERLEVI